MSNTISEQVVMEYFPLRKQLERFLRTTIGNMDSFVDSSFSFGNPSDSGTAFRLLLWSSGKGRYVEENYGDKPSTTSYDIKWIISGDDSIRITGEKQMTLKFKLNGFGGQSFFQCGEKLFYVAGKKEILPMGAWKNGQKVQLKSDKPVPCNSKKFEKKQGVFRKFKSFLKKF